MRVYALICTRTRELKSTTKNLVSYLSRCGVTSKLIVNSPSIFFGYSQTYKKLKANPEDIIILCHDDIKILSNEEIFLDVLTKELSDPTVGFIGPAGTTELTQNGVWWDHDQWKRNKHRGLVFHGHKVTSNTEATFYGQYGDVAVLDGLFLAAKAATINKIGLKKPNYLEGDWDYYDIHYTHAAKQKKLINRAVPILLCHNSAGVLVGRDSWHRNRVLFIEKFKPKFPITV